MNLSKVLVILALGGFLFIASASAQTTDVYGQVRIYEGNCYSGIGMNGVTVLLYDETHTVEYTTATYTDEQFMIAHNLTSPMGIFYFDDVPYREDYLLEVVAPIGVDFATDPSQGSWWNANPRAVGTNFYRCFLMVLSESNFEPHTIGFWKHQANVAVKGKGNAQIPEEALLGYLALIFEHFDGAENFPINGVSSVAGEPLDAADALNTFQLPNGGPSGMVNKAKKQLLALLLNVASEYVYVWDSISVDNRTISEAITFGADMITNSGSAIATAKDAMDYINNGITVPPGWIPSYGLVYYGEAETNFNYSQWIPESHIVVSNYPNPFNPETVISFNLPEASSVTLSVFNLQGQKVADVLTGNFSAGVQQVVWNAAGYPSGTYLYQLNTAYGQVSGKMVLLK